jgi:hypothetical protein
MAAGNCPASLPAYLDCQSVYRGACASIQCAVQAVGVSPTPHLIQLDLIFQELATKSARLADFFFNDFNQLETIFQV